MTSPEILMRLVRRFGLLVLLTVIGGIAGGLYGAVKTPTYQAQSYVVATAEAGESIAALNFAQAYGRIATSGPVADRVAAKLGSRADLKQVTAATSPDAPVIEITATGTSAKRTADVANAVANALVEFAGTQKNSTRVGLAVLAVASVPTSPSSPKPPLELAVGAGAGLLIGGLTVLAGVGRPAKRDAAGPPPPPQVAWYNPPAQPRPGLPAHAETVAWYNPPRQYVPVTEPEPQPEPAAGANGDRIVGRAVVHYRAAR